LLAAARRPSAVFAANDSMAIGLLGAARELGIGIPADLAVVGFDDVTIARYLNPPLTSVGVDAFGLGQQAAKLMFAATDGDRDGPPAQVILPTVLQVRESCGAKRTHGCSGTAQSGGSR
jgi:LacI family transcriptional regulator